MNSHRRIVTKSGHSQPAKKPRTFAQARAISNNYFSSIEIALREMLLMSLRL